MSWQDILKINVDARELRQLVSPEDFDRLTQGETTSKPKQTGIKPQRIEEIAREQAHDAYEEDAMRDRIVGMLDNGDFDYQLEKAVKKVLKEVADGFAHS